MQVSTKGFEIRDFLGFLGFLNKKKKNKKITPCGLICKFQQKNAEFRIPKQQDMTQRKKFQHKEFLTECPPKELTLKAFFFMDFLNFLCLKFVNLK